MFPNNIISFEEQMQPYWNRASRRHITQVNAYIISFATYELDPNDPHDCEVALEILCEFARKIAPGHQAAIFLQKDGKGGKLHGHVIVNDVNFNTYKGLPSTQYHYGTFSKVIDDICEQYFDLRPSNIPPEKVPKAVRKARSDNEIIRAENELEIKKAAEEHRPPQLKEENYIWQDDLKNRINVAADGAENEEDFFNRLLANKVRAERRHATKTQPEYYLYELLDTSNFKEEPPSNLRSKSLKLGGNYQPEEIAKRFKASQNIAEQEDDKTSVKDNYVPNYITAPEPAITAGNDKKVNTDIVNAAVEAEKLDSEPVDFPKFKAPKKSAKEMKKEDERQAMEKAKNDAKNIASKIFTAYNNWTDDPTVTDGNGRIWADFNEKKRRRDFADKSWKDFIDWRKKQKASGNKLNAIYANKNGFIFVIRHEFEKQYMEFLNPSPEQEKRIRATLATSAQSEVKEMSDRERFEMRQIIAEEMVRGNEGYSSGGEFMR